MREIVAWFEPLYPYKKRDNETPALLQIEDVNFAPGQSRGEFLPLLAIAISAKRYALFNLLPFEEVFGRQPEKGEPAYYPVLRKISAHGTGQIKEPKDFEPLTLKPEVEIGL